MLFDERYRDISKLDYLRRYGTEKQTTHASKPACPHNDLIRPGFSGDPCDCLRYRPIFCPGLAWRLTRAAPRHRLLKYFLRLLRGESEAESFCMLNVQEDQGGHWTLFRQPKRVAERVCRCRRAVERNEKLHLF
jgi:hypothetical protein